MTRRRLLGGVLVAVAIGVATGAVWLMVLESTQDEASNPTRAESAVRAADADPGTAMVST